VAVALAGGCRVIGISDHLPFPDGRWSSSRMDWEELDGYETAVRAARAMHPRATVRLGLEAEYDPALDGWYRDELLGRRGYDYLIGAGHFTPLGGAWLDSFRDLTTATTLRAYAAHLHVTMASGLFAFISHPDLFGACNAEWNADLAACARDVCAASLATGVPLELNGYGLRKEPIATAAGDRARYPWEPFWAIAGAAGVRVVLSSDAHRPADVLANHDDLCVLRDRYGLREAEMAVALA